MEQAEAVKGLSRESPKQLASLVFLYDAEGLRPVFDLRSARQPEYRHSPPPKPPCWSKKHG